MKKHTLSLAPKLTLGKQTIAGLDTTQQNALLGGKTVPDNGCVGSNHCDIRFTELPDCRIRTVQADICPPNTFKCL